mgnify:CR=1 FL=1
MFPLLNLTKETPIRLEVVNWLVIVVSIMFYHSIGQSEAKLFTNSSAMFIILFNLIAAIVGMVSQFLLEFGEVTNIYNFTIPNIILHIVVAVVLSSVTWLVFNNCIFMIILHSSIQNNKNFSSVNSDYMEQTSSKFRQKVGNIKFFVEL